MSRRFTPRLLLLLLLSCGTALGDDAAVVRDGLLGPAYPLEARVSFHAALLHWMDALAGLRGPGVTGGKTDQAHRLQYQALHGGLTPLEKTSLGRYVEVRSRFARQAPDRINDLTLAFFDSPDLEAALRRAAPMIGEDGSEALRSAMSHFASRYRPIWDEGRVAHRFVDGAIEDPRRAKLGALLHDIAEFFGVERIDPPWPSIVVVPVPDGYGTHAQAVKHDLLLEVRSREDLIDEADPIVHENAHFLFYRLPRTRRDALGARAARSGPDGAMAWRLLHEALPTALGQGVAGARFREGWSMQASWYHVPEIDHYAKVLFPMVRRWLAQGRHFDESFVDEAVALYLRDLGRPDAAGAPRRPARPSPTPSRR